MRLFSINKKRNGINLDNRGFTLVELLATIVVIALISGVVIYIATNVIRDTKEKSYQVSINNVEKNSGSYALENQANIRWVLMDNGVSEYYCVTVQDLIDMGYLDVDVLKSEIAESKYVKNDDYIYLERNASSKTIEKNMLLTDNNSQYAALCNDINSSGVITFNAKPIGWSKDKEVTINYRLLNILGNISEYDYYYIRDDSDEEIRQNFSQLNENVIVEEVKGKSIIARIYYNDEMIVQRKLDVSMIDAENPKLELIVSDGTIYSKNKEVTISLKDNDSGFKKGEYQIYYGWSLSDLSCEEIKNSGNSIMVSVDTDNLKSVSKRVTLSGYNGAGKVYACTDGVEDYVGNSMGDEVFSTEVYLDNDKPIVTLGNYEKTDSASGNIVIQLIAKDNTSSVKTGSFTKDDIIVTIGNVDINSSNIALTRVNNTDKYNLEISNKSINGLVSIKVIKNGIEDLAGNKNDEIILNPEITYKVNKVTIKYHVNGGSIATVTNDNGTWTINNNLVYRNGTVYTNTVNYGTTPGKDVLSNYNNSSYMNISLIGHTAVSGAQWICHSGCTETNKTFDQNYKSYSASDFCDASNGDCTVVLKVNWVPKTYTISYDANGGTGTMNSTECAYGGSCTLRANSFTRSGYTFLGWSKSSSATSATYNDKHTFSSYNETNDITLYAIWKKVDITPPVCTISATGSSGNVKLTVTSSDSQTEISYSGWNSSYSGTNSNTKTVSSTGTYTYYVMDDAGNKGSCSVDLVDITYKYTCSKAASLNSMTSSCTASNFSNKSSACSAGYSYGYDTCSKTTYYTRRYYNCAKNVSGAYVFTSSSESGTTSCSIGSSFTCNASSVGRSYIYRCQQDYEKYSGSIVCYKHVCSSGSISGDTCYKYNQSSCSSGWSKFVSDKYCSDSSYTELGNYCFKSS